MYNVEVAGVEVVKGIEWHGIIITITLPPNDNDDAEE